MDLRVDNEYAYVPDRVYGYDGVGKDGKCNK